MSTIDRNLLWTGSLNERAISESGRRIGLYDTTLRDGEQAVGVVLNPTQKLELAKLIDGLGVDRIEAGFPRVSDEDREAIAMIRDAKLKAEIWGFSRAVPDDVKAVAELGLRSTVIEAPVSDMKLRALGVEKEQMLKRVVDAVSFAKREGIKVAFFGVDSSRGEMGFLESTYRAAVDAGASEIVMVDTIGIASPEGAAYLVENARKWFNGRIPVHFHGHNDFGLATASAIAAIRAGADWIQGTIDGMGERAGNADLGQVALAYTALYRGETNLQLGKVRAVSLRLREIAGYDLEPWKAIVGTNLFRRETGAVAAQFHIPEAIEPYSSKLIGASRSIVLGKKSGLASIGIKVADLGLNVPKELHAELLAAVKAAAVKKRGLLTDEEFKDLAKQRNR